MNHHSAGCSGRPTAVILALAVCLLPRLSAQAQAAPPPLEQRAKAALARTSGTLQAPGLQAPVKVIRDHWGVAHIYAQNQHDLFFAQGWVASQDRLFQMEMWKRVGQGRLSEVLGPQALNRDRNALLLAYRGDMAAEYASYSPDTRDILTAFTSGINAYIASLTAPGGPGLPIEFQLAGFAPTPWRPEDCLTRMAGFPMTGNALSELRYAKWIAALGKEGAQRAAYLDPPVDFDPAPGLDFAGLGPELLKDFVGSDARIEFPSHAREGSNNWTVSGKLTATGKPMLAGDPHRTIALPSLRYMVHLVAPGWDVIGAGEPGLPGVALGHNQHIAWSFTIFGIDQQDLYLEQLNPANPLEYKTATGWQTMRVEKATIPVKGEAAREVELHFTQHGPVLWEDTATHRALALRWVGAEPGTAGYLGSLAVDRASNWTEFEAAMDRWKVPSENIVYADTNGHIGEHSVGLAPKRHWTGLLPVPGDGQYEWDGFLPTSELPHSFDPKAGFIATANHKMIPPDYPYHLGYEWAPPYRIERIKSVLDSKSHPARKLDRDDMAKLKADIHSYPCGILKALEKMVARHGMAKLAPREAPQPEDCTLDANSADAALAEIWLDELNSALAGKLSQGRAGVVKEVELPVLFQEVLDDAKPEPLCELDCHPDIDMTLLTVTLEQALARLKELLGPDRSRWSWGALHQVKFRNPVDQLDPAAARLFDLPPIPRPGDEYTVNATGFGANFEQTSGASYRQILDLGDWDRSLAVNTPGQSGQPLSPHYSDLVGLWSEGKYFPLAYSEAAVTSAAEQTLVLQPH